MPETELLEHLASLVRELGRFPVNREIKLKSQRDPSFHSHTAYRRLGGQRTLASRLRTYALERGYNDVAALCDSDRKDPGSVVALKSDTKPATGFVYLMKSGRYFKIGRTISVGSRERQLAVTIPIPPTTIHSIETDDPVGFEAYWHKRFETKRGQGEWFNLSPEDIEAFKRWKRLV